VEETTRKGGRQDEEQERRDEALVGAEAAPTESRSRRNETESVTAGIVDGVGGRRTYHAESTMVSVCDGDGHRRAMVMVVVYRAYIVLRSAAPTLVPRTKK